MRRIVIFVVAVLCALSVPVIYATAVDQSIIKRPIKLTSSQEAFILGSVKSRLKDPISAVFGDYRSTTDASGDIYVCGLVNAKNAFGAYVGDRLYLVVSRRNGDGSYRVQYTSIAQENAEASEVDSSCQLLVMSWQ